MQTAEAAETLVNLHNTVTKMFETAKAQGALARENLRREEPVADADTTERQLHHQLMLLGQQLMQTYFAELGTGDLGYHATFNGQPHTRKHAAREKSLLTVFGKVVYQQAVYYAGDGQSVRPVEVMADLPEAECSYFAQDLLARLALTDSYEHNQAFYKDLFGHSFSPTTIQRSVIATAAHDEAYQQAKPTPEPTEEGAIGVVSFDGKGVPVRPDERTTGSKREALVGTSYTIGAEKRHPDTLAQALVMPDILPDQSDTDEDAPERARHTRYHVGLGEGKETLFEEVRRTAGERFASANVDTTVCLMDGATKLWKLAATHFPDAVPILDLMHVQTYLYDAVEALEADAGKARIDVAAYLTMLLHGQVGKVIGSLKIRLRKNNLRGQKQAAVEAAITYFNNHREAMRYDEYLAKGYPIATGVVESACGHIVKDRMEKAGARWSIRGANALLKLRAARANGDWHTYIQNRKHHERQRLYGHVTAEAA